jgi:nonsense-mediated mRNA decay protein 3
MDYERTATAATVLCYNCSAPIDGSLGTICAACLRLTNEYAIMLEPRFDHTANPS